MLYQKLQVLRTISKLKSKKFAVFKKFDVNYYLYNY